jgi:hypothetical protein
VPVDETCPEPTEPLPTQTNESSDTRENSLEPNDAATSPAPELTDKDTEQTLAVYNPLVDIPPRYFNAAEALLVKLEAISELCWEPDSGDLCIRGQRLELTIGQFLRAVCVPFTKASLPPVCRQLLHRHDIQPRNHLLNRPQPPTWHPYFRF